MPSQISLTEDEIDDLFYLARVNDLDELKSFLSELQTKYNTASTQILSAATDPESENTTLHYAAANGHLAILKHIHSTFSPNSSSISVFANQTNQAGNTALHWASLNGHLECVKWLVKELGADVTVLNAAGHDAVYEAEVNGKEEVMQWLLKEGGSQLERALGGGGNGPAGAEEEGEDVEIRMSEGDVDGEDIEGKGKGKGKEVNGDGSRLEDKMKSAKIGE